MDMARIGATDKGGVCRLALSDLDREGRDLFVEWCEAAGCAVTVDRIGNIFARREGRDSSLPPILTGSHLDTQPTGGKFDGAYGVLAGLEVIRALNDHGVATDAAVEVCVWTNEEGSRFAPTMMGSGVFAGVLDLDEIYRKVDEDGKKLGDELTRIGYAGAVQPGRRDIRTYFEAHIEQGPMLEAGNKTVGVVTGAQGLRWHDVVIAGQESHAGTTPMPRRKDALAAAAALVLEIERIGHSYAPGACATCGGFRVHPGSRNTIPGRVRVQSDMRHPDDAALESMDAEVRAACRKIADERCVTIEITEIMRDAATQFDEACVKSVREAARGSGYSHCDIVSGAAHDAIHLAKVAPSGMIFIPCKDGISHNEAESATKEDCEAGCQVLYDAVIRAATGPGDHLAQPCSPGLRYAPAGPAGPKPAPDSLIGGGPLNGGRPRKAALCRSKRSTSLAKSERERERRSTL